MSAQESKTKGEIKNPISRLLGQLPAALAEEKWELIKNDLTDKGVMEHWRQHLAKMGSDMSNIKLVAARVFVDHLGVNFDFFDGGEQEQDAQIRELVKAAFEKVLSETGVDG